MKLGLTEKTLCIHNPLPRLTENKLIEISGLDGFVMPPRVDGEVFGLDWTFSSGAERERVRLAPGETLQVRASGAKMFVDANAERGAVSFEPNADDTTVLKAKIEGCQRALRFWQERGAPRLMEYRKTHGLSEAELAERKGELWAYYAAIGRSKTIEAHIKKLRGDLARAESERRKADAA